MARRKREKRRVGTGAVYRRISRHTGEELPTWWLSYSVAGRQRRESTKTADHDEALRLLRERMGRLAAGTHEVVPGHHATIGELLADVVRDYELQGRGSLPTMVSTQKTLTAELGDVAGV